MRISLCYRWGRRLQVWPKAASSPRIPGSAEKKLNPKQFTIAYGGVGLFKQFLYVGCNRAIEGIRSA